MKLSDAILEGCKKTKKERGRFFSHNVHKREVRSVDSLVGACAVGAALLTKGIYSTCGIDLTHFPLLEVSLMDLPEKIFPKELKGDPILYDRNFNFRNAIYKLNDDYDWSREAIAMWVSTVEDYLSTEEVENTAFQPDKSNELAEVL